jgi:hypothetical protein
VSKLFPVNEHIVERGVRVALGRAVLKGERVVGGLSCSVVLADLSRLLDGELPGAEASRLPAHVSDCDFSERFGRRFAGVLRDPREGLREPEPLEAGIAARLRVRTAVR